MCSSPLPTKPATNHGEDGWTREQVWVTRVSHQNKTPPDQEIMVPTSFHKDSGSTDLDLPFLDLFIVSIAFLEVRPSNKFPPDWPQ